MEIGGHGEMLIKGYKVSAINTYINKLWRSNVQYYDYS